MIWSLVKLVGASLILWLSVAICLGVLGFGTLEILFWPFVLAFVLFEWLCTALVYSFIPALLFFGIKNLITRIQNVNNQQS